MDQPITTYKIEEATVEIHHDTDCTSPRDNCNLGSLWLRSRWSITTNETDISDREEFEDYPLVEAKSSDVERYLKASGYIFVEVSLRSGEHGFNIVSRSKVRDEYGWKLLTKKRVAQIEEYLKGEIEEYEAWCAGECYGYVVRVIGDDGLEYDDSCWGFIGDYDGYIREEADNHARHLLKRHCTPKLPGMELAGV